MKRLYSVFFALCLSACSANQPPCPPPAASDIVYIVSQGWHAEIGIPSVELKGDLAYYRSVFPGARVVMFGYGKKTFFTAPPETVSEYFLGPVPGPAAIHAFGLSVAPMQAYPGVDTATLALPPGGAEALSNYIWNDLEKDAAGKPRVVSRSSNPDGLFYEALSGYSLMHTCNTWTADALHASGLNVSGRGVAFSSQVMQQTSKAAKAQCVLFAGH